MLQKKGAPLTQTSPYYPQTSPYYPGPGLPDSPPNVFDCSNKKQQFEQEITTAAQF